MVCFLKKKKLHKSYWEICDRQSRRQWRLRKVRPFHQGTLFSLKAKLEGKKGKGDCMHLFLSCYTLCFMAGWTSLGQGRPKQHFISGDEQSGILQKSQRAQGSSRLLHLGVTYSVFYALSGVFFFSLMMVLLEARPSFPVIGTFTQTKRLSSLPASYSPLP